MTVTELTQKHGFNIWISCNKPYYKPFKVISHIQGKFFNCQYEDGKTFELHDCLDDYELISKED